MTNNKVQALHGFWSSFGWAAYEENSVPDKAKLPYITYEIVTDSFRGDEVTLTASLWDRSTSWAKITDMSEKIATYLNTGVFAKCKNGYLWIKKASPFAQHLTDSDKSIKRIILTIKVEYWTES